MAKNHKKELKSDFLNSAYVSWNWGGDWTRIILPKSRDNLFLTSHCQHNVLQSLCPALLLLQICFHSKGWKPIVVISINQTRSTMTASQQGQKVSTASRESSVRQSLNCPDHNHTGWRMIIIRIKPLRMENYSLCQTEFYATMAVGFCDLAKYHKAVSNDSLRFRLSGRILNVVFELSV